MENGFSNGMYSNLFAYVAYQNPKQHIDSFVRGAVMYFLVAVVDGMILTLI